ncbi:MAG: DUF4374 domain-containing protein [Tannerellaceae bacterium]|jgi:hypothetical protein|nr:DUF4374 domain-containing protein [Tannerellaceae bacterium]
MFKSNFFSVKGIIPALMAICLFFTMSCDKKDNPVEDPVEDPLEKPEFVIVATSDEASYLLQTDDLTQGELTIVNSGLETDNGTEWEFNSSKYLYRLQYNQGNAGTSSSYVLNSNGQLEERSIAVEIRSRFTTHGSYGKYVVTAAAAATDTKDDAGNAAQGVTFTYIDAEAQTLATKTVVTENFLDNGEYVTFSGIAEANGKLYTAVCPLGVSTYGAANGAGEVRSGTGFPDNVWIAVFDNTDFTNPRIISDSRLSYATSRFRSQYYTNLAVDDRDNVYVFSSAYDANTTKPSGVLRIKAGADAFDPDFFFNIEQAAGGRHLYKVFYISGDYFLLQMYSDAVQPSAAESGNEKKLAIFDAANLSFRWVTGIPAEENIGSFSKKVAAYDGKAYIAVVPTDGSQPAIYYIDAATATAAKGTVVTCTGIVAAGKLIP